MPFLRDNSVISEAFLEYGKTVPFLKRHPTNDCFKLAFSASARELQVFDHVATMTTTSANTLQTRVKMMSVVGL